MSTPKRIRLSRQHGWRKPEGTIVVSRPSKWGNPFVIGNNISREESISLFKQALLEGHLQISVEDVQRELKGHDLGCWCPLDQTCHADLLLAVSNGWLSEAPS